MIAVGVTATVLVAAPAAHATAALTSTAFAVNNKHEVVGTYSDSGTVHAVRWDSNGGPLDLGTLGGSSSWAYAINARSEVVGVSETADGSRRAFRYTDATGMTALAMLPGATKCGALDINDRSDVVGYCVVPTDTLPVYRAVLWTEGRVVDIDTVPAGDGRGGTALAINDVGEIFAQCEASTHLLVIWPSTGERGYCEDFRLDTTRRSQVEGPFGKINDSGEVVVTGSEGFEDRAVLWRRDESGRYSKTDVAGTNITVSDINERTEITGTSNSRAFIWIDGVTTDLGTLGGPASEGYGINDRSEVVGSALTGSGVRHAFLWSSGTMTDLGARLESPEMAGARTGQR